MDHRAGFSVCRRSVVGGRPRTSEHRLAARKRARRRGIRSRERSAASTGAPGCFRSGGCGCERSVAWVGSEQGRPPRRSQRSCGIGRAFITGLPSAPEEVGVSPRRSTGRARGVHTLGPPVSLSGLVDRPGAATVDCQAGNLRGSEESRLGEFRSQLMNGHVAYSKSARRREATDRFGRTIALRARSPFSD